MESNGDLRHRDIVRLLPDLIFINRRGHIAYVNEAGVKLLRAASADDIVGRSAFDFFHPDYHPVIRSRVDALLREPRAVPAIEEQMVALDGAIIDVEVRAISFLSNDGETDIQVLCRDITEKKNAERAMTAAIQNFHNLAEAMPLIVWTAEPDGAVDFASKAFADYTGLTADTPAQKWLQAIHPGDVPRLQTAWAETVATGSAYSNEFRIRRKDGAYRWHFTTGVPIRDGNGRIVKWYGSATDVHDRRAIEEEALSLAHRLTLTLESMTDAFIMFDGEWRFTYANQETERLLRRPRTELLGRVLWDEFPGAVGTLLESELKRAAAEQHGVSFQEFAPRLKIWIDARAFPTPGGLAVYFRDVTEQRDLEARLRQAQRLHAIGQLTGGVAHDFNNLLTVMIGNAEMMLQRLPDGSDLQRLARTTLEAADRGADLTRRLLAFARKQALEPRAIAVDTRLSGMDDLLHRALGENIKVERVGGAGLWNAFVDPPQLETAVLNLCINARDAMPDGGHLTIETANATLDEAYAQAHDEVTPGDYVMVAVSDTGAGMTPDVAARVFEPFFTTKGVGKGSGLGLSMVHGFVKQSGGHVKVYSEPGHGTTIKLYLPRADGAVATAAPAKPAPVGGKEKILIVEDDPGVLAYASAQLAELGYAVVAAKNGHDALEAIKASPDFDLLFTDVVMPAMNGPMLAAEAQTLMRGLRVLFTSGYTENAIVHHGRLDAGVMLLNKPYRRHDLAAKVRQALDAKPDGA
jgi:PAS domain S-box-containing protein